MDVGGMEAAFPLREGYACLWGGAEGMKHHLRVGSTCKRHGSVREDMFWLLAAAADGAARSRDVVVRTPDGRVAEAAHRLVLEHRCPGLVTMPNNDDGNDAPATCVMLPVNVPARTVRVWLLYLYCNITGIRLSEDVEGVRLAHALADAVALPDFGECFERCVNELLWHSPKGELAYTAAVEAMAAGRGGHDDVVVTHGKVEFPSSRVILQARGDFFCEALDAKWQCTRTLEVPPTVMSEQALRDALGCLHRKWAGPEGVEGDRAWERAFELHVAAGYLGMPDVVAAVEAWMHANMHHGTVCSLWNAADALGAEALGDACERMFKKDMVYIAALPDFTRLERHLLRRALHPGDITWPAAAVNRIIEVWARAHYDRPGAALAELQPLLQDLLPPHTMLCTQTKAYALGAPAEQWLRNMLR